MLDLLRDLWPVLLGAALAQLGPGPSLLIVAQTAMARGRRSALGAVAGIVAGYGVWASLFAAGMGALIAAHPGVILGLKMVGGAVLLALAWRGLTVRGAADAPRVSGGSPFRAALWVDVTNPKAALIWSATSVFLVAQGPAHVLVGSVLIVTSAAFVYGGYALVLARPGIRRSLTRVQGAISTAFATLSGVFGAALIWQGLREARP